jgi:hypothetical protein
MRHGQGFVRTIAVTQLEPVAQLHVDDDKVDPRQFGSSQPSRWSTAQELREQGSPQGSVVPTRDTRGAAIPESALRPWANTRGAADPASVPDPREHVAVDSGFAVPGHREVGPTHGAVYRATVFVGPTVRRPIGRARRPACSQRVRGSRRSRSPRRSGARARSPDDPEPPRRNPHQLGGPPPLAGKEGRR